MSLWNSFKKKLNEGVSGLDFWDTEENRKQREAAARPAPAPVAVAPQPQAVPKPAQGFKGFSLDEGKNKTILGWNAAALLPRSLEKTYGLNTNRDINVDEDTFVSQFDKIHPDFQKKYVSDLETLAKDKTDETGQVVQKGDANAANSLRVLREKGRFKGGPMDFVEGANERLYGGLGRGTLRTVDWVLPGKNTLGLEKLAEDQESPRQFTRAGKTGETFGTVEKGLVDLAAMALPAAKADQLVKGTKIVSNLEKGGKLAQTGAKAVRVIPGSLVSSGVDVVQTKGRGDEINPVKSTATGLGIDLAMPVAGKILKKTGADKIITKPAGKIIRAFRGGGEEATETAGKKVLKELAEETPNTPRANVPVFAGKVDDVTQRGIDDVVARSEAIPQPKNTVRVFQSNAANGQPTNWVFDNVDSLKAYKNNTTDPTDTFEFLDVPKNRLQKTANGEHVFTLKPEKPPKGVVRISKEAEDLENAIYGTEGPRTVKVKDNLRLREKLSPDRQIRKVTNAIEEGVNRAVLKAQTSKNPLVRGAGRFTQGISREAGVPRELLEAKRHAFGGAEYGKLTGKDVTQKIGKEIDQLGNDSGERIWAALDPEQAAKKGIATTVDDLTPEELAVHDRIKTIVDSTTEGNLSRGLIDEGQAANTYLTRRYQPFEDVQEYNKAYTDTRRSLLDALRKRGDKVDEELLDKAITDPAYLAGKRLSESHQAWAMVDYGDFLGKSGYVSDVPQKGLVQLPESKLFGSAAGKYVPQNIAEDFTGFHHQWGFMNSLNDLLTAYDRLGIRQAKKGLLTVANPAVRAGNQMTNRMIFSTLNGMNPVEFNKVMLGTKKLIKNRDPVYLEAVRQGLIGTDVTKADFTNRISQYVDDPGMLKKASNWVKSSYSQADDRARLAAFQIHLKQGYDPSEAARLVQRGFQDYKSVGFFYDMAAKFPVFGNAFVRFAGDSIRIAKNAALDHPLRTMATVGLWATLTNGMSHLSGESAEDKATREGRFGSPKIPFTDISLAVQTPWGEVNLARFMPFYQLNDVEGQFARFLPIQGDPRKPAGWNDPLLGQVVNFFSDKDFRGKSIRDPDNIAYDSQGNVKKFEELDEKDKRNNLLRWLGVQNAPLGREADALISSLTKQKDIYGKQRDPVQAALRAAGIKVEQFGPEQAEEQRGRDKYFEGNIARVKQFTADNPDLEQAYYKFNNPTRDRESGVKSSDLVSPERWGIVQADASGRLFGFLKNEAFEGAKDGKPVDPIFRLPRPEQERLLLELRSRPTGDDIETEEMLRATQPWYGEFEKAESDYYKNSAAYYEKLGVGETKQNPRVKEYGELYDKMYPKQSDLVTKYYQLKSQNGDDARAFYKDNADQLSDDFAKYRHDKLAYINAKRKIEGYDPISESAFNNVTFGYEDDERKVYNQLAYEYGGGYGRGYGGGGSGGSGGGIALNRGDFGNTRAAPAPKVTKVSSGGTVKVVGRKPRTVKLVRSKKA